jgi:hypothetical protein
MKTLAALLCLGIAFTSAPAFAATSIKPLPAMEFTGRGTQIYACDTSGAGYAWVLKGPDAQLYDASGKVVARHFFGPRWQANDGSRIRGILMLANASPQAGGNAPWLVLRAVVEHGDGIFARVSIITRTDSQGGGAPATACDATEQGKSLSVPYTAKYTFFSQPPNSD